jgi:hypothetical protein
VVKTAPAQQEPDLSRRAVEGLRLCLILNTLLSGQKSGFFWVCRRLALVSIARILRTDHDFSVAWSKM